MTQLVRKRIIFSGRVQGVGFRFHTYRIATSLKLTGWVKNEWDRTVLAEIQGTEDQIDQLVYQLHQDRYIRIDHMDVRKIEIQNQETSFQIIGY